MGKCMCSKQVNVCFVHNGQEDDQRLLCLSCLLNCCCSWCSLVPVIVTVLLSGSPKTHTIHTNTAKTIEIGISTWHSCWCGVSHWGMNRDAKEGWPVSKGINTQTECSHVSFSSILCKDETVWTLALLANSSWWWHSMWRSRSTGWIVQLTKTLWNAHVSV